MALPVWSWKQSTTKAMVTKIWKCPVKGKADMSRPKVTATDFLLCSVLDAQGILLINFSGDQKDNTICWLGECFEKVS